MNLLILGKVLLTTKPKLCVCVGGGLIFESNERKKDKKEKEKDKQITNKFTTKYYVERKFQTTSRYI